MARSAGRIVATPQVGGLHERYDRAEDADGAAFERKRSR